jgi:tetratricopeptide (TPR) repeat protein
MEIAAHFDELCEFANHLSQLLLGKTKGKLEDQAPCNLDDAQEQLEATIRFMESSRSHKESGDYVLAGAELAENFRYYCDVGDIGKCGHVLLEIADCLFCAKQFDVSIDCCTRAVPLLIKSRNQHDWARGMSAVGELLLTAIVLNLHGSIEAQESLRKLRSSLAIKERRILSNEDAHRITRRLIKSFKSKSPAPLEELRKIAPRRKRAEQENLFALLEEWTRHFKAVSQSVDTIPIDEKSEKGPISNRAK